MRRFTSKKDIQRRRESRRRNRQERRREQQRLSGVGSESEVTGSSEGQYSSDSSYVIIPDSALPEDPQYIRCVICLERANHDGMGPLINPCDCRGEMGRYHYSCLCDTIIAQTDEPCARCGALFRERRIERYLEYPSFSTFLRRRLLRPEPAPEPNPEGRILPPLLAYVNQMDINLSILIIGSMIFNGLLGADINYMSVIITGFLIYWYNFAWPVSYQFYNYLHSGRIQRMIQFTDYEGPDAHKLLNLTVAQREAILRRHEADAAEAQAAANAAQQQENEAAQQVIQDPALNLLEHPINVPLHNVIQIVPEERVQGVLGYVAPTHSEEDDEEVEAQPQAQPLLDMQQLARRLSDTRRRQSAEESPEDEQQFISQIRDQPFVHAPVGQPSSRQSPFWTPSHGQPFLGESSSRQSTTGTPSYGQPFLGEPSSRQSSSGGSHLRQQNTGQPFRQSPTGLDWNRFIRRLNEHRRDPGEDSSEESEESMQRFINELRDQTRGMTPSDQPPIAFPPADQPPIAQPPIDQPYIDQPYIEQPPIGQPLIGQPYIDQAYIEQPPIGQPLIGQPYIDQPYIEQPPIGQPHQNNIREFQDMLDEMDPEQVAQLAPWIIPPEEDEDEQDNNQG